MRAEEEKLRQERIKHREEAIKFEEFKAKVKSDDSGLTILDLKKLNSVYKREYINIIMEDEKLVHHFV